MRDKSTGLLQFVPPIQVVLASEYDTYSVFSCSPYEPILGFLWRDAFAIEEHSTRKIQVFALNFIIRKLVKS
jgi:hypothetical protein